MNFVTIQFHPGKRLVRPFVRLPVAGEWVHDDGAWYRVVQVFHNPAATGPTALIEVSYDPEQRGPAAPATNMPDMT